jgi:peroxiredoxin
MAGAARSPGAVFLLCALAVALGPGLWALLDGARLLPVPLRASPWPFEALALLCWGGAAATCARRAPQLPAAVLLVAAGAASAWLPLTARAPPTLPPPSPELPLAQPLPSVALADEAGAVVDLSSLAGRPALIVFFRGASCPYCRAQLAEIANEAARFQRAGVQIVAISPDPAGPLARLRDELALELRLLSDVEERAVSLLCGGRSHCELVTDASGTIRWAGTSESWADVPAPALLLQAAWRLRAP